LIFPSWESELIRENLREVIYANANYLSKIAENICGRVVETTEYKLARKDVFLKSGNLSAAFERMTSEPKSKQKNVKEIHKFVVLNHILSSYIATVAAEVIGKRLAEPQPEISRAVKKSLAVLNDISIKLGGKKVDVVTDQPFIAGVTRQKIDMINDNSLLKEQLGFINKISNDIARVTDNIVG
jgi:hypothetical protein